MTTAQLDAPRAATRREFVAGGLSLAALLAGCGGDEPRAQPAATAAETELRIVDLSDSSYELAVLGLPVAGNIYGPGSGLRGEELLDLDPAVRDGLRNAAQVAPGFEPDVEEILALRPDVVLSTPEFEGFFGPGLERLRKAGQRVELVAAADTWQGRSRALAVAVGREDRAAELIADTERRQRDLRARIQASDMAGATVSVLRQGRTADELTAFVRPSVASEIIAALGLTQPRAQLTTPGLEQIPDHSAQAFISEERLGEHDGDALIFLENAEGELAAFTRRPTAAVLGAVEQRRTLAAPYVLWALPSMTGVRQMLADVEAVLL